MSIELDDDVFDLVLEAVRQQVVRWEHHHASLTDEHMLHVHHGRTEAAVITDGLRRQAARFLRDYQRVLNVLQAKADTRQPPADPAAPPP